MKELYVHPYETTEEEKYMDEGGYGKTRNVKRVHRGITLRDQFAMAALQSIITVDREYSGEKAAIAYDIADAMLEARKTV